MSAGARFWQALEAEKPLQVAGTINAYSALLANKAGFRAIYLSGAGVANASFGLPDLAMTTLGDVCEDIRRISYATELPLLVDAQSSLHRGQLHAVDLSVAWASCPCSFTGRMPVKPRAIRPCHVLHKSLSQRHGGRLGGGLL